MGLVLYPKISDYWSRYFNYHSTFVPAGMSRNRFQDILRFLHFANYALVGDDRLGKILPLILPLVQNLKKFKTPGTVTVTDGTLQRMADFEAIHPR